MKTHGRFFLPQDFAAFLTLEIGVEDESVAIESLQENHADIGKAIFIDRRKRYRIRIVYLGTLGIF
ncbi:hypothetical protein AJ87_23210 [Rhizobium yanglingense]|nr:hypothetical protein AJ87_23210 [Rhizobium yanglingense]